MIAADAPAPGVTAARGLSLKVKAAWAIVALAGYMLLVTLLVSFEREFHTATLHRLQAVHAEVELHLQLSLLSQAAARQGRELLLAPDIRSAAHLMQLEFEPILGGVAQLRASHPAFGTFVQGASGLVEQLAVAPSRADLAGGVALLDDLADQLDALSRALADDKAQILADYDLARTRMVLEWSASVLVLLGATAALGRAFLLRLLRDVGSSRERAHAIAQGYQGEPLSLTRRDEVGALMEAINELQHQLRQRDSQIEMARQQRFHQEKMAVIGAMAAALAHEIRNPLASIMGVAESMEAEIDSERCKTPGAMCRPTLIMEQSRRLAQITQDITDFSLPQSSAPDWLDLNGLLRRICHFVSFDRRFSTLQFACELDDRLPALYAVGDHLTQVVLNLLFNAADAIAEKRSAGGRIGISTGVAGDRLVLAVEDNGIGIAADMLERVFDEFYTTKPNGTGVGLAVSRHLIRQAGGEITVASRPGEGAVFRVCLPLAAAPA